MAPPKSPEDSLMSPASQIPVTGQNVFWAAPFLVVLLLMPVGSQVVIKYSTMHVHVNGRNGSIPKTIQTDLPKIIHMTQKVSSAACYITHIMKRYCNHVKIAAPPSRNKLQKRRKQESSNGPHQGNYIVLCLIQGKLM
jgi:hypothetical protein